MPDLQGWPGPPPTLQPGRCSDVSLWLAWFRDGLLSICRTLLALTGGNATIETIREKHAANGTGSDVVVVNPLVDITDNCCAMLSGTVCIPQVQVNNLTTIPDQRDFNMVVEIKCDGQVVETFTDDYTTTVPDGGFAIIPKQFITINAILDFNNLAKTPAPGQITVCTSRENVPNATAQVSMGTLIICQQEI